MEDVVRWLSSGLLQLREPDPADAPLSLNRALADAFLQQWSGDTLADQLMREVWRASGGDVALQHADPSTFTEQVRGPAAYLLLTARKRVLLTPDPDRPLRFDA